MLRTAPLVSSIGLRTIGHGHSLREILCVLVNGDANLPLAKDIPSAALGTRRKVLDESHNTFIAQYEEQTVKVGLDGEKRISILVFRPFGVLVHAIWKTLFRVGRVGTVRTVGTVLRISIV